MESEASSDTEDEIEKVRKLIKEMMTNVAIEACGVRGRKDVKIGMYVLFAGNDTLEKKNERTNLIEDHLMTPGLM